MSRWVGAVILLGTIAGAGVPAAAEQDAFDDSGLGVGTGIDVDGSSVTSTSTWQWTPVNGFWVWSPVVVAPVQPVQSFDQRAFEAQNNPSQQTFDPQDWRNSWNAFQSQSWSNAPVQNFDAQDNWVNSYNTFQSQAWQNAPVQSFSSQGFVGGNPSFGQQAWRPNQRW